MTSLLCMAVFANVIHASTSSDPADLMSSNGGKKRTRHHAQITVQHVDDGDEMYHEMMIPLPHSQPKQQRHDSRTRTRKLRMQSSSVNRDTPDVLAAKHDGDILLFSTSETNVHYEEQLPSWEVTSRELRNSEYNNLQYREKNYNERELNQQQYITVGMPSSRESDGDREYQPKGVVVRRGRLFHNSNSKGGKRNGKGDKWSKGSKWRKSWNECYWEDTP